MKHLYLTRQTLMFATVLMLLLVACKKSTDLADKPADTSKHLVQFDALGFSRAEKTMQKGGGTVSAMGDTLANHANFLYCTIFNADGSYLKSIEQTADSVNFGKISEHLSAGSYTVIFVASKLKIYTFLGTENLATFKMISPFGDGDTFFKKLNITVAPGGTSYSVRLERIIGAIDVIIEDEFPENAANLVLSVDNDATLFSFENQTPEDINVFHTRTTFMPLTSKAKGQKISVITFNTVSPMTVTITCTDSNQNLLARKNIQSVTCSKNTRTLLTGKLFSINGGFSFGLNAEWIAPSIVTL